MRNVKPVKVGDCILDGKHIYIQSMLNARSDDIEGNVRQAVELEKAGCEIIRVAVPDMEAVKLIPAIKSAVNIPTYGYFSNTSLLNCFAVLPKSLIYCLYEIYLILSQRFASIMNNFMANTDFCHQ